jgi:hypothetical protein
MEKTLKEATVSTLRIGRALFVEETWDSQEDRYAKYRAKLYVG